MGRARGISLAVFLLAGSAAYAEDLPPPWAYPVNPPDFKLTADDGLMRHVPDSDKTYSVPQTRDRFLAPDWHPGDHAPMPTIVAQGRKPDVSACGYCHRADGPGGPENANISGLSYTYIIQQMHDFRNGQRNTSVPKRGPPNSMIALAKAMTDEEIEIAAAYFAAQKPRATLQVVETETVPKTYVAGWFLAKSPNGETEPIGSRIIEVPVDLQQFESRDARARFTVYVPPGSIAAGKALAAGVGEKTAPCATCHGADLKGTNLVPGIAGRSPSYLVRQLYDLKQGVRAGPESAPMQAVAKKLDVEDMVSLAAYAASLAP